MSLQKGSMCFPFFMERAELFTKINEGIIDERFHLFQKNVDKNAFLIKQFGGLRCIVDLLRGKDVIIAGAGSSIDKEMFLLREAVSLRDVVLICADMAYLPLLRSQIIPDFVITCETSPNDYFIASEKSSRLLAFSCSSNSNLRRWKGQISFYNWMMKGEYEKLWEKAGTGLGYVSTGSTVISQAVSLALGCGIKSLALIGNDLAYKDSYYMKGTFRSFKDELNYSRIATCDSVAMNYVRRARQFVVKSPVGDFYSHNQFLAAKYWLEELFAKSSFSLIECSLPGCRGSNILNVKFDKYLKYLKERL